jgi:hypothetical protein
MDSQKCTKIYNNIKETIRDKEMAKCNVCRLKHTFFLRPTIAETDDFECTGNAAEHLDFYWKVSGWSLSHNQVSDLLNLNRKRVHKSAFLSTKRKTEDPLNKQQHKKIATETDKCEKCMNTINIPTHSAPKNNTQKFSAGKYV